MSSKLLVLFFLALASWSPALGAIRRTDLPDIFHEYLALSEGSDFSMDFRVGSAVFEIRNVYGTSFRLAMLEELSVFDTEPNAEIEMCNGTATDLKTRNTGESYSM